MAVLDMDFDYALVAFGSDEKLAELGFFSKKEKPTVESMVKELKQKYPVVFVASKDALSLALLRGTVIVYRLEQEHRKSMN